MAKARRKKETAARIAERRAKVAQLWKARYTVREIAEILSKDGDKVSKTTVATDQTALIKEWRKSSVDEIERQMLLDLEVLNDALKSLYKGIRSGDLDVVRTVCQVIDRREKILGYAAPQRHEVTGKDGKDLVPDLSNLPADKLEILEQILAEAAEKDASG